MKPERTARLVYKNLDPHIAEVGMTTALKWADVWGQILALPFDPTPVIQLPVAGEIPWK
jgi:hypothetical protein